MTTWLYVSVNSYLADEFYRRPVIVYEYPKEVKPFYVRVSDDGRTVSAFDIIAPKVSVSKKVHAYISPRRKCCNFLTLHCASYIMSRLELWSEEAKRRNAWMWSSRGNPSETPREKASWLSRAIILDLAVTSCLINVGDAIVEFFAGSRS